MPRGPAPILAAASSILAGALGTLAAAPPQDSAAPGPGVRLIRSTSGTRGAQQGSRFVVEDPRSAFQAGQDRQVIVYFEWEGRPGLHKCKGRWKDPTGKVVLVSPVEYTAPSRRFGIYWTLTLPEAPTPGLWALETAVDGQPGGTHTFEVGASALPAGRAVLSQAEIYKRALAAVAVVDVLGDTGEVLARGPALALDAEHVLVGFPLLEGAATLRLRAAGKVGEAKGLAGWSRAEGWALVPFPGSGLVPLPRAPATPAVGDHAYVVHGGEQGDFVIAETSVVGEEQGGPGRLRLHGMYSTGSPLVDDTGQLAGMVVGGVGEADLGPAMLAVNRVVRASFGGLALPAGRLPGGPGRPVTLAELAARGEFPRPLSADRRHVISGVFAARVERRGAVPIPLDQRFEFSRKEGRASVFVQWDPKEKRDATSNFLLYDGDNRPLGRGEGGRLKMRPGQLFFTTWTFDLGRLSPGTYRIDVVLDDAPVWRGSFRLTE